MIQKCYPNGKTKAFNVTYDDGVLQDVRLVRLLNKYGIRGTFNLNSGLMKAEFEWIHENGMVVKRLSEAAAKGLYDGHEIASHTLTHPYMSSLSEQEILYQMTADKQNLQRLFDREVRGFAVPFSYYSDLIAECARKAGFTYARMSEFTLGYCPWQDRYHWKCGFYHIASGLRDYVDGFLSTDEELAMCQIVGHSYDLDAENLWGVTEDIFREVSADSDVWLATNLEIIEYLMAMNRLRVTDTYIENGSDRELWLRADGEAVQLLPGEKIGR